MTAMSDNKRFALQLAFAAFCVFAGLGAYVFFAMLAHRLGY